MQKDASGIKKYARKSIFPFMTMGVEEFFLFPKSEMRRVRNAAYSCTRLHSRIFSIKLVLNSEGKVEGMCQRTK